jgi:hypothetical protein
MASRAEIEFMSFYRRTTPPFLWTIPTASRYAGGPRCTPTNLDQPRVKALRDSRERAFRIKTIG